MKNKRHLLILGLLCCVQSSDAMYGNPKNIAAVFLTTLLASTYGKAALSNSRYTPSHFSNNLSSFGLAERPIDIPTTSFPQSFSNISMPYEIFYQPTLTKAQLQDAVSLKTSDGKAQSEIDLEKQSLPQLRAYLDEIMEQESTEHHQARAVYQSEYAAELQREWNLIISGALDNPSYDYTNSSEYKKISSKYKEPLNKIYKAITKLEKAEHEKYIENYIRDLGLEGEITGSDRIYFMSKTYKTRENFLERKKDLLQCLIESKNVLIKEKSRSSFFQLDELLFDNPDAYISALLRMPDHEQKLKIVRIERMLGGERAETLDLMHQLYLRAQKDFNKAKSAAMKKIDEMNSWNPFAGSPPYRWDAYDALGVTGASALSALAIRKYVQSRKKQGLWSKKDETIDMGQLIKAATGGLYTRIKATEGMENFKYDDQEAFTAAFSLLDSAEDNGFDAMFSPALNTIGTDQDPGKGDEDKIKATVVQDAEKVLARVKIYQGRFDMDKLDDRNVDTAGLSDEDHTMLTQYHKLIDQDIMFAHDDKKMLKNITAMAMDDMSKALLFDGFSDDEKLSALRGLEKKALNASSSQARSQGILRPVRLDD